IAAALALGGTVTGEHGVGLEKRHVLHAQLDPTAAELMGVNIHNVLAICFGLGLGMAGIAGSLLSTLFAIQTSIGLGYTVIAMIVVVLGGLGSITGAMIGGIILGLVSATVTYFQPSLTMIAYYVIFIVLLLSRPKGIMGK
ncbi:MAG: branched-chain amino acid ABC transporter permease, partial [Thermoleophilia bacterium]|nr:branched-chain amino acid ABC transporter permease [Thermoleophilia bacterium]